MSYKLYVNYTCPFAHRALIVCAFKNVTNINIEEISLKAMPDWFKKLNNRETVPALQFPNGKVYPESYFICQYIDEHWEPKNQLLPIDAESRHNIQNFVDKCMGPIWACHSLLAAPLDEIIKKNGYLDKVKTELNYVAGLMNSQGPFAVGSTFTMADVAFAPFVLRMFPIIRAYCGIDLYKEVPHYARYIQACRSIPAFYNTCRPLPVYISQYERFAAGKKPHFEFTLYSGSICPFSKRVELALARVENMYTTNKEDVCACGFKLKIEKVDVKAIPENVKKLNPDETVPVMITPEDSIVSESMGAMQYVADTFPEANLMPATEELNFKGRIFADLVGTFFEPLHDIVRAHRDCRNDFSSPIPDESLWAVQEMEKLLQDRSEKGIEAGSYLFGKTATIFDFAAIPFLDLTEWIVGGKRLFAKAPLVQGLLEQARADALYKRHLFDESIFNVGA